MVCQLHFCFPLLASRALTSSCFFACSMSDDTGGQDGLRRGGRPSSAARSIDICRSAATNDSGSSTPRTHQGTCSPPRRRVQGVWLVLLLLMLPERMPARLLSSGTRFRRSTYGARPRRACGRERPWQVWHRSFLQSASSSRAILTSGRDA